MASNYSIDNLKIYGDSRHVIQIMRRGYASPGSKADRYMQIIKANTLFSKASFFHILRENNRVADLAANQGIMLKIGQIKDHKGVLGFHYIPNALMPWLIELLMGFLVRVLASRDHPLPFLIYGLPLILKTCKNFPSASPLTRSSTCLPVRSSICHLVLSLGVSSHGDILTPPLVLPIPPSAMALPPHLPESMSRLSLGELDTSAPRFLLEQADNWDTMPSIRATIAALSRTLIDIKFAIRSTYDAVCSNVNQNAEMASDITHVCSLLSCQDSRIDDLERNIFELMGKVDRLQEDMAVFTGATQGSWVHENPTVNQEINQVMVDASSAKLRKKG